MATSDRKINLAGTVLNGSRHICAFFHSKDEEFRTLGPFILEGLADGDKAIHIINANNGREHRRRLIGAGVDVAAPEQSGQLQLVSWADSYLQGGRFDPERAMKMISRLLNVAREQGYRRSRLIGDMDWALENRIRTGDLLAYEAQLNTILAPYDDPVVCAYDLSRFRGADVLDVMRTHPVAIVGGALQRNPFYIPPEQMLEELRERGEIKRDERER